MGDKFLNARMSLIKIKSSGEESEPKSQIDELEKISIKDKNVKVWLADLTYTQQQISSDVMPAAIGGIATFTESILELKNPIQIYKYPEKLILDLEKGEIPNIIGFSNYLWSLEISLAFARRIKQIFPKVITVFGGPNYPIIPHEQKEFLTNHPEIDFYIKREGEMAFANLVSNLTNVDFQKELVSDELLSVDFIRKNKTIQISETIDRIHDLTNIPSPYLDGKMDEFFDGKFQPIIQTNRGCPFSCTFCVEGELYYNRVNRSNPEKIDKELEYIAKKMKSVREKGGVNNLHIVDSNFGMYNWDIKTCEAIAHCQDKYDWPEYISVNTGKNNKEKVLNAANLVRGAIRLSGSVQTLDPQTLKNIKRSNISTDKLMDLAIESSEMNADSRSEIILCLPGETKQSHFNTIKTIIDAGFNRVDSYQLMMLPGTDLSTDETKKKYEMSLRYRVLPRDFGYYSILGKTIHAAEIEEVCISTNTLSFEDYLDCRKMHLIVQTIYNNEIFGTVVKFIKSLDISPYSWIKLIHESKMEGDLKKIFDEFENETRNELWTDKKQLEEFVAKPGTIQRYIDGELGLNLLYHYSGLLLAKYVEDLAQFVKHTVLNLLENEGKLDNKILEFIDEIISYDSYRYRNIFSNIETEPISIFKYDIMKFLKELDMKNWGSFKFEKPLEIKFVLKDEQKNILDRSIKSYGSDEVGISRIITRVFLKKLLREPVTC
jgi:radical SAM superfamily enzyme YgiQ (UPF0313 family)